MKDELTMKEFLLILAENPETIFEGEDDEGNIYTGKISRIYLRDQCLPYEIDRYGWVESVRLYKEPKPEFPVKMGDQVLVSDDIEDEWRFDLFSHISGVESYPFHCGSYWKQLIQITDKNRDDLAEIVGTLDDPPTGIKVWTKEDFE